MWGPATWSSAGAMSTSAATGTTVRVAATISTGGQRPCTAGPHRQHLVITRAACMAVHRRQLAIRLGACTAVHRPRLAIKAGACKAAHRRRLAIRSGAGMVQRPRPAIKAGACKAVHRRRLAIRLGACTVAQPQPHRHPRRRVRFARARRRRLRHRRPARRTPRRLLAAARRAQSQWPRPSLVEAARRPNSSQRCSHQPVFAEPSRGGPRLGSHAARIGWSDWRRLPGDLLLQGMEGVLAHPHRFALLIERNGERAHVGVLVAVCNALSTRVLRVAVATSGASP